MNNTYSLTTRIVIGMLAGVAIGALLKLVFPGNTFVDVYLTQGLFLIIGKIFVASLKMLVVPLVFVSLVCGTCSLRDTSKLGRLGIKSLLLYLITTALALTLAIIMALLFKPGDGIDKQSDLTFDPSQAPSLAETVINLFPSNPIQAMADGNMLQIIVFSLLFGIAIVLAGDAGKRVVGLFEDLNVVVMKLVTLLMNIAPYGVFALMAQLFLTQEFSTIKNLLGYFALVFIVLLIHAFITYPLILKLLAGLSPIRFMLKMRDAVIFAFSTASSNATIPVTMETVTRKLGAHNSVASFTVPLGSTINMDGTAIMQGVATVFIAQAYGIDLTLGQYVTVVITATLASIGTAGVPGVGLVMLTMVLQQVGLPVEGIALIIGVDRLLDMTRTAVNITGDSMVTCVVAKSEGALNETVFNNPDAGLKEEEVHLERYNRS